MDNKMTEIRKSYRDYVNSKDDTRHTEYSFIATGRNAYRLLHFIPVDDIGIIPVSVEWLKGLIEELDASL